jgi:hypothetical protein
VREQDLAIITANDAFAPGQLDQDGSHDSIVARGTTQSIRAEPIPRVCLAAIPTDAQVANRRAPAWAVRAAANIAAGRVTAPDENESSQLWRQTAASTRRSATRCSSTSASRGPWCRVGEAKRQRHPNARGACSDSHSEAEQAPARAPPPLSISRQTLRRTAAPAPGTRATLGARASRCPWKQPPDTDARFRRKAAVSAAGSSEAG